VCVTAGGGRLAEAILDGSLHYGDPPNVRCCEVGPSMNCVDVRVLEFWSRPSFEWARDASHEVEMRR
jgi:hypothetical protein